tara:strand:+ start:5629 stop:6159 length:531 start_codon:yes stop_codon:yes gene_type:complete
MERIKAEASVRRLISYIDWVGAECKKFTILHAIFSTFTIGVLLYGNIDVSFVLSFAIPAVILQMSAMFFSKALRDEKAIREKEADMVVMLTEADGDFDLKVEGDYSLKEVFEYKSVFESATKDGRIPNNPLLTVRGLKSLFNPLPYLLLLMYGWVFAVGSLVWALTSVFVGASLVS